ncbi:bacterial transcriptional activator domain-containing protein [Trinickia acidisoli]|uniref:bacterial transcriptional activator domain-containing protein n=1 Tax=Trinickia acidisoli TaxID=2767482 RepID=UPI001A8C691E|nr:bacterial transcriptional activator domain-containing protein [Trinickia acidisoli]
MTDNELEVFTPSRGVTHDDTMLRLALVPRFTLDMAQRLSGRRDIQTLLAWLTEQRFCESSGVDDSIRYVWAPTVRETLRMRAQCTFLPEHLDMLETVSVALLEEHGFVDEAVRQVLDAHHWQAGIELMLRHAGFWLERGRAGDLLELLELVPRTIRLSDTRFCYLQGLALLHTKPRRAVSVFRRGLAVAANSGAQDEQAFACLSQWMTTCVLVLKMPGQLPLRAWGQVCRPPLDANARLAANTAFLYGSWFQPVRSIALARRVVELERAAQMPGPVLPRVQAAIAVLLYLASGGALGRARAFMQAIAPLVLGNELPALIRVWWMLACAFCKLVSDDSTGVESLLQRASAYLEETGSVRLTRYVALLQCGVSLVTGDGAGARVQLYAAPSGNNPVDRLWALVQVWLALREERIGDALTGAHTALRHPCSTALPMLELHVRLTYGYALLRNGDQNAARQVFAVVRENAVGRGSILLQYHLLLNEALLEHTSGHIECARELLRMAFRLARHHGLLPKPPYWAPAVSAQLCDFALQEEIDTAFVTSLVSKYNLPPPTRGCTQAWPWPIRIYSLGPFRLLYDGVATECSGKTQRRPLELLKAIVAYGGRAVDAQLLGTMLWPDAGGEAAQRSFEITLHRLRKLLKNDDAVHVSDKKVSLNTAFIWCDALEFKRLVNTGLDMLLRPQDQIDVHDLLAFSHRALNLYQGDFLQLEEASPWILMARDKLRSQWLRFVLGVGQVLSQERQVDLAIGLYQRCLESDPLAEEVYRRLMQCYQAAERYAEAIRVYQRCREMFSIVLGIAPSENTTAVYRACLGR